MKIAIITRFGLPLDKAAKGYYYRLYYLAEELVKRGHEVTVLANSKSKTKAKLVGIKVVNSNAIDWESQLMFYGDFLKKNEGNFDIINCQTDHLCCFFAPFIKTPIIHTIIFGHFWKQVINTLKFYKNQYFSTISFSNKKQYPFLNWQGVVYNGVDEKQFKFGSRHKDYLLFLGRVIYEKGIEDAIKIAEESGNKLIIAGAFNPLSNYFNEKIKPRLTKDIIYFGHADLREKIKLLREAKALLHPHLFPEGLGNSMIESIFCGTPVIAYPHGSTPEVVKDKKTGFIVKNISEAKKALKKINEIDRSYCREFALNNFSIKKMVDGYEEMFKKIIAADKKNKINFL